MSDQADVKVPVTPYKEGSPDLMHPNEHHRGPRKRPHVLHPQSVAADIDLEKRTRAVGQHPKVRRQQRPELFQRYLPIDMVRSAQAGQPPLPQFEAWIRDILEPGVVESLRGRFLMAIDPAYRRWTLYQIVNTKHDGQACSRLCVFAGTPRPGYLPSDLDGDPRFAHLRGSIGDFKVPNRLDFEEMRGSWDRRSVNGQETSIRAGSTHINNLHNRKQAKEYEDKLNRAHDQVLDIIEYNFRTVWQAANNGMKLWSNENIVPLMNPRKYRYEQRNGYKVKTTIPREELDAAIKRVAFLAADLVNEERGLQKDYEPSKPVEAFVDAALRPDADVFELVERGEKLLLGIAVKTSAPLTDDQAKAQEPRHAALERAFAQKVKVPA